MINLILDPGRSSKDPSCVSVFYSPSSILRDPLRALLTPDFNFSRGSDLVYPVHCEILSCRLKIL